MPNIEATVLDRSGASPNSRGSSVPCLGSLGLAALSAGLFLLAPLQANATSAAIIWRMALCGIGFGFFQAPNNRTLLGAAPKERAGAAGGMLATARLTGQTAGASLAATLFVVTAHGPIVALWTGTAVSLLRLTGVPLTP